MGKQVRALTNGVDILVATPGRLLDLVQSNALRLDEVEVLVLDEADRMLDMGFIHDIRKIVAKLPQQRQTLFFSATMPRAIAELAEHMLRDPARVAVTPAGHHGRAHRAARHPCRHGRQSRRCSPTSCASRTDRPRPRLHPHQARRRRVVRSLGQVRHRRRGDPRQQVAGPARARARRLPQRQACASWSPPTSPPAASTSTASPTSSTTTCRTCRRPTCTASAAPRAPAPTASRSRSAITRSAPFLRDIEKLIRMTIPATDKHGNELPAQPRPATARTEGSARPQPPQQIAQPPRPAPSPARPWNQNGQPGQPARSPQERDRPGESRWRNADGAVSR